MDLRIVNVCNNNCVYCLEQSYRKKEKYDNFNDVCQEISKSKDNIINFYWWNSLLHPELLEIVKFSKWLWFTSIWLLTNTYWLNIDLFNKLIFNGLNNIWFYFNSFDSQKHNLIVNSWISLKELLSNIEIIRKSWIFYKAIIHINNQNINSLYKDIYILNVKFWVKNFEFINYFPFDRPYDEHKNILEYNIDENRGNIDKLFQIIKKSNLSVKFSKFSKDFFWNYKDYYDFKKWILDQIGEEDMLMLSSKNPFCYLEQRCNHCFIKDNCPHYAK